MTCTTAHEAGITGVVYSPDGQTIATCSKDNTVHFYSSSDLANTGSVSVAGKALGCAYSPDGTRLAVAVCGSSGGLAMIDVMGRSVLYQCKGPTNANLCVAYSPRGDQVATAGDNSKVSLWDPESGDITGSLVGHQGWIWCVLYTQDGSRLFTCSSDRLVCKRTVMTSSNIGTRTR